MLLLHALQSLEASLGDTVYARLLKVSNEADRAVKKDEMRRKTLALARQKSTIVGMGKA
jgi:hypothetical protein